MKAKVIRIDPIKTGRNGIDKFIRLYFKGDMGGWSQTDVVLSHRNYKNWKPVIESGVGTEVEGLEVVDGFNKSKVNGDSPVRIVKKPVINSIQEKLI